MRAEQAALVLRMEDATNVQEQESAAKLQATLAQKQREHEAQLRQMKHEALLPQRRGRGSLRPAAGSILAGGGEQQVSMVQFGKRFSCCSAGRDGRSGCSIAGCGSRAAGCVATGVTSVIVLCLWLVL